MPGLHSNVGPPFPRIACNCASAIASTVWITPSGMGNSSPCRREIVAPVVSERKWYPPWAFPVGVSTIAPVVRFRSVFVGPLLSKIYAYAPNSIFISL